MSTLQIVLETTDSELIHAFEEATDAPKGVTFVSKRVVPQRAPETHHVIEVVLQVTGNVTLGILSNWLYDKLKNRMQEVTINRKKVSVQSKEELEAILDEVLPK